VDFFFALSGFIVTFVHWDDIERPGHKAGAGRARARGLMLVLGAAGIAGGGVFHRLVGRPVTAAVRRRLQAWT
jgi:peptidoglycan/LPS O-acetylase OafA/YrhL